MTDQFFTDKKSQKQLEKFYEKAPKAFQRVSAGVLNGMAFDERGNFQKSISRNMTIRSPGLLKKLTRVKTTPKSKPINSQEARTFTTPMARHEGWKAAVEGGRVKATQFTDEGRIGGKQAGKAKKGAKAGGAFTVPSDLGFGDRLSRKQVPIYLQRISSSPSRRRKSFLLPVWYKKIPPGIYRFVGGSVRSPKASSIKTKKTLRKTLVGAKMKRMSTPDDTYTVKSYDWQNEATKVTTRQSNVKRIWESSFNHELNKIKIN